MFEIKILRQAFLQKKHEEQAEENKSLHNLLNSYTREGESFKLIIAELQVSTVNWCRANIMLCGFTSSMHFECLINEV